MNCRDCICPSCLNYYGCHVRECEDCDYGTHHCITNCPDFHPDYTEEELDILRKMAGSN